MYKVDQYDSEHRLGRPTHNKDKSQQLGIRADAILTILTAE